MAIKSLLKGETIKIDNHHPGQGITLDDQGLHFHKRFNERNKKRGRVDVIIKLNDDIEVEGVDGQDAHIIIREIRDIFQNKHVREDFIKSAKKSLEGLATIGMTDRMPNQEVKNKINRILIGITEYFGVRQEDISHLLYRNEERQEVSLRYDRDGNNLYVKVDLHNTSIALTHDRNMLNRI